MPPLAEIHIQYGKNMGEMHWNQNWVGKWGEAQERRPAEVPSALVLKNKGQSVPERGQQKAQRA